MTCRGIERRLGPRGRPRRGRDLAVADLPVAARGLRLRRGRLRRRRPGLRHARRVRRAGGGGARARPAACSWTSCRATPRSSTRWFREHPDCYVWATARAPRTTGAPTFGGPAWSRDPETAAATCTPSTPSSPTSTGATPRWSRRCRAWSASGSTAASTASASTRIDRLLEGPRAARRPAAADAPPRPAPRREHGDARAPALAQRARRRHGASPRCARRRATPCSWARSTSRPPSSAPTSSTSTRRSPSSSSTPDGTRGRVCARRSRRRAASTAPAWVLSNHDFPRLADPPRARAHVRAAVMLLLTLPGLVFVYQGDEIGHGRRARRRAARDRAGRDGAPPPDAVGRRRRTAASPPGTRGSRPWTRPPERRRAGRRAGLAPLALPPPDRPAALAGRGRSLRRRPRACSPTGAASTSWTLNLGGRDAPGAGTGPARWPERWRDAPRASGGVLAPHGACSGARRAETRSAGGCRPGAGGCYSRAREGGGAREAAHRLRLAGPALAVARSWWRLCRLRVRESGCERTALVRWYVFNEPERRLRHGRRACTKAARRPLRGRDRRAAHERRPAARAGRPPPGGGGRRHRHHRDGRDLDRGVRRGRVDPAVDRAGRAGGAPRAPSTALLETAPLPGPALGRALHHRTRSSSGTARTACRPPPKTWDEMIDAGRAARPERRRSRSRARSYEGLTVLVQLARRPRPAARSSTSAAMPVARPAGRAGGGGDEAPGHLAPPPSPVALERQGGRGPARVPGGRRRASWSTTRSSTRAPRRRRPRCSRTWAAARYPRVAPGQPSRVTARRHQPRREHLLARAAARLRGGDCACAEPENQIAAAEKGGLPPTHEALYETPEIKKAYPLRRRCSRRRSATACRVPSARPTPTSRWRSRRRCTRRRRSTRRRAIDELRERLDEVALEGGLF